MPLRREEPLNAIISGLAHVESECRLRGPLRLLDGHTVSQHFFCRFLNELLDLDLVVLDRLESNFPAIDLGDAASRRCLQITADKSGEKVQATLDTFVRHGLTSAYDHLQILIIGDRQKSYKALSVPAGLRFDADHDIVDVPKLCRLAESSSTEKLTRLAEIVRAEIRAVVPASEMSLHVDVVNAPPREHWNGGEGTQVRYHARPTGNGILIDHGAPYLERLKQGGPIAELRYQTATYSPFDWDFPALDLKLLNTTASTFFLAEVVLNVDESTVDVTPIIALKKDLLQSMAGYFVLANESAVELRDVEVCFALLPGALEYPTPPPAEYPFTQSFAVVEKQVEVSVLDALHAAGANVDELSLLTAHVENTGSEFIATRDGHEVRISYDDYEQRIKAALGPYQDCRSTAVGEISFTINNADQSSARRTVRFKTLVYVLNENRRGLPKPPTFTYNAQLRTSGANYEVRVPISHEIKAGESDRFLIRLGMDASSVHRIQLSIVDVAGRLILSPRIELRAFVPRSRAGRMELGFVQSAAKSAPASAQTFRDADDAPILVLFRDNQSEQPFFQESLNSDGSRTRYYRVGVRNVGAKQASGVRVVVAGYVPAQRGYITEHELQIMGHFGERHIDIRPNSHAFFDVVIESVPPLSDADSIPSDFHAVFVSHRDRPLPSQCGLLLRAEGPCEAATCTLKLDSTDPYRMDTLHETFTSAE